MSLHSLGQEVPPPHEDTVVPSAAHQAQDGYPKLARHMAYSLDNAIFRRFGQLNILNLLRLQAELQVLEKQLEDIRMEDIESTDPIRKTYSKDFCSMRDNEETGDSEQHDQLILIGKKLDEYSETLLFELRTKEA